MFRVRRAGAIFAVGEKDTRIVRHKRSYALRQIRSFRVRGKDAVDKITQGFRVTGKVRNCFGGKWFSRAIPLSMQCAQFPYYPKWVIGRLINPFSALVFFVRRITRLPSSYQYAFKILSSIFGRAISSPSRGSASAYVPFFPSLLGTALPSVRRGFGHGDCIGGDISSQHSKIFLS